MAQTSDDDDRIPVPEASALERVEDLLRDVYGSEIEAAKSSLERAKLARRMMSQASESRDNKAEYYVLLRAARVMATRAGDAQLAMSIVRRIATTFDVDSLAQRIETLQAVGKSVGSSSQYEELAEEAMELMDDALADDQHEAAQRVGEMGVAAARRAREQKLAKRFAEKLEQLPESAKLYRAYQEAVKTLEGSPTDAAANLTAAEYLCFVKGDWEKGIPLLALTEDEQLRNVGRLELEAPREEEQQVALADAWWSYSKTREGRAREGAMLRAGAWYQRAKYSTSGLTRTKIESRLDEIEELDRSIPRIRFPSSTSRYTPGSSVPRPAIPPVTPRPASRNRVYAARARLTMKEHTAAVNGIAFSPDSSILASTGIKEAIRYWDPQTGRELKRIDTSDNNISNLRFSPDGKLLAASGLRDDQAVHLFDAATGKELRSISTEKVWLKALAFSPDGTLVGAAGDGGQIKLWDVNTGEQRIDLPGHKPWTFSLAFSPDGQLLASSGCDRMVRIWSPASRKLLKTFAGHQERVWSVAYTPDGKSLVSSGGDKTIIIWDPQTGQRKHTMQGHEKWVRQIAISPDSQTIASAGYDFTVRLWDIQSGRQISTLKGHTNNRVECVAFSPDGKWLASGGWDFSVRIWELLRSNF